MAKNYMIDVIRTITDGEYFEMNSLSIILDKSGNVISAIYREVPWMANLVLFDEYKDLFGIDIFNGNIKMAIDPDLNFNFFCSDLSAEEMIVRFMKNFENHGFETMLEEEFLKDINLRNLDS